MAHFLAGVELGDPLFDANGHQLVRPGRRAAFTYPWLSEHYPMTEEAKDFPKLVLSAVHQTTEGGDWVFLDGKTWSGSIDTCQSGEEFVCLAPIGDVKVTVEKVGKSTYVFLDGLSHAEVSAKDIRSRIGFDPVCEGENVAAAIESSSDSSGSSFVAVTEKDAVKADVQTASVTLLASKERIFPFNIYTYIIHRNFFSFNK